MLSSYRGICICLSNTDTLFAPIICNKSYLIAYNALLVSHTTDCPMMGSLSYIKIPQNTCWSAF
jgi:hypothetical protein